MFSSISAVFFLSSSTFHVEFGLSLLSASAICRLFRYSYLEFHILSSIYSNHWLHTELYGISIYICYDRFQYHSSFMNPKRVTLCVLSAMVCGVMQLGLHRLVMHFISRKDSNAREIPLEIVFITI